MGWTFTLGYDKKDMVKDLLIETATRKVLDHSVRGSRLWVAFELVNRDDSRDRVIALFLLRKDGYSYGYKDMDETMGPYYYDCPLKLLKLVPDGSRFANEQWRAKVREYWAIKKAERDNPIEDGCTVRVKQGWKGAGTEFIAHLKKHRRRWYVYDGHFASLHYPRRAVERV